MSVFLLFGVGDNALLKMLLR